MADSNVSRAQEYLNAMFGGHPDWGALESRRLYRFQGYAGDYQGFSDTESCIKCYGQCGAAYTQ